MPTIMTDVLPFALVPAGRAELGEDVARLTCKAGYGRLQINVNASREDQLGAIADACRVLAGERSSWAELVRAPRHLRLVAS